MIGSDFQPYIIKYRKRCTECGEWMEVDQQVLASIKDGKVKKIVCSEDCRQEFDYKFWSNQSRANTNNRYLR